MKLTALLLSLLLSCPLLSCAALEGDGTARGDPAALGAAAPENPQLPDTPVPPEEGEDIHAPAEADNVVPHETNYYCGNTITTIRCTGGVAGPPEGESEWEKSFWGSPSVELTDLLLFLDYSGDICRCLPEYEVTTEFSDTPYGINLTEAYARHDGGQVSLTEEQVSAIRSIIDEIAAEKTGENGE